MKRISLILLAILSLMFASCSGDDDGNDNQNVSIDGTWKLTAWNASSAFDINNDGTANINILDELNCYDNETIVFSANNTAVVNSTSYADITGEIIVGTTDEYMFMIDCVEENDTFLLTWSLNGNTIIFDDGTEDQITGTLTGNQISIVIEEGLVIYNDDYTEIIVNQDLTFVYTKQ